MHIVAGSARGMRLVGPGDLVVRPMAARVRTSLFDTLSLVVGGSVVLDCFAGCGAVGLEALSRGASSCAFVEMDPRCCKLIEANLAHTRLADKATVIAGDVFHSVERLRALKLRFGLVFVCPPYKILDVEGGWEKMFVFLTTLIGGQLTAPGALIIVEHRTSHPPADLPSGIAISDRRRYGGTTLTFMETGGHV